MRYPITKHGITLVWGLACAALLSFNSGCSQRQSNPHVLARVGDLEITEDEFKYEVEYQRSMGQGMPSREDILTALINKKVLFLKAKALGLEKDIEIRRGYEDMLVGRLKETEITSRLRGVQVSDAEIQTRYQQDIQRYTQPGKVHLSILFVATPANLTPEQKQKAQARLAEARDLAGKLPPGTRGFGALAIDYSEDQASRYRGGDIGWYDAGEKSRWPDEVMQAGFNLNPGEISSPIETSKGYFLVAKMDSRPGSVTPLLQVTEAIKRHLLAEKRQAIEHSFLADLRRNLTLETNQTLLRTVPLSNEVLAGRQSGPPALP